MASFSSTTRRLARSRRRTRVRSRMMGSSIQPRLSVFRSHQHIYAQLIDDAAGRTLAAASDATLEEAKSLARKATAAGKIKTKSKKSALAFRLGEEIARQALIKKIKQVVFDRGGYPYTGRVKAVAEGARQGGLTF